MNNRFDRRSLLKRSAGLAAASTLLPTMRPGTAYAQGQIPKRLVVIVSQHGVLPWLWRPSGGRTDFKMDNLMLQPLAGFRDDLILLGGVDYKALTIASQPGECGHAPGQSSVLTAQTQLPLPPGTPVVFGKGSLKGNGISIDQHIANGLAAKNGGTPPTPFPYMHMGMANQLPNLYARPFHSAAGMPMTLATYSMQTAYARWFKNIPMPGMGSPGMPVDTSVFDQRRSVLDFVAREYDGVKNLMGKFEADRFSEHAQMIRQLEKSIELLTPKGGTGTIAVNAACKAPEQLSTPTTSSGWWNDSERIIPDMIHSAFACNLTQVIGLVIEDSVFDGVHDAGHKLNINSKESNPAADLDKFKQYVTRLSSVFAKILKPLSETKEADGKSLLHHTAVVWTQEIAQPGHTHNNNKWMIGGQLGGYLKTGQFMDWGGDDAVAIGQEKGPWSNGDVWATIANGMGVPTEKFGHPGVHKGEISDLKA